jgi:hypothetical protein
MHISIIAKATWPKKLRRKTDGVLALGALHVHAACGAAKDDDRSVTGLYTQYSELPSVLYVVSLLGTASLTEVIT